MPNIKKFCLDMASKLPSEDSIDSKLYTEYDVKRGLRNANGTGVLVGLTNIGTVRGYAVGPNGEKVPKEGKLYYRGYSVEDLVENCVKEDRFGFEEITYLLMFGKLPTAAELKDFNELLGSKRELPGRFAREMLMRKPSQSIMNMLERSVLALYSYDDRADDTSIDNLIRQSIEIIGYFPALIAYSYQSREMEFNNNDLHIRFPKEGLSTSQNILRMLRSDGKYSDLEAKLLDLSLIVHAEHGGGNNSCFTTHLVSSTGTDTYSAIAASLGSLKGPKHGGANIKVVNMIHDMKKNIADITDHAQIEEYLKKVLRKEANDGSGLIYGIGHAIYTLSDPRAVILKKMALKLAEEKGLVDEFNLCKFIESDGPRIYNEFSGKNKQMCANVDLYSGFVYEALNIPEDVATPLFAMARLSGWCAHRIEELVSAPRLMRPAYESVHPLMEYVPLEDR